MEHEYDDIINLPRPRSKRHAPMAAIDRAAQFAPFAALSGYEAIVRETARLTEEQTCLAEDEKERLDTVLSYFAGLLEAGDSPEITVKYFEPDDRKNGGRYVSFSDVLRRIDEVKRSIVFACGTELRIDCVVDIILKD